MEEVGSGEGDSTACLVCEKMRVLCEKSVFFPRICLLEIKGSKTIARLQTVPNITHFTMLWLILERFKKRSRRNAGDDL